MPGSSLSKKLPLRHKISLYSYCNCAEIGHADLSGRVNLLKLGCVCNGHAALLRSLNLKGIVK